MLLLFRPGNRASHKGHSQTVSLGRKLRRSADELRRRLLDQGQRLVGTPGHEVKSVTRNHGAVAALKVMSQPGRDKKEYFRDLGFLEALVAVCATLSVLGF